MAETEDLEARVDVLERAVVKLTELMAGSNMHTNSAMADVLKQLLERRYKQRDMKAEA